MMEQFIEFHKLLPRFLVVKVKISKQLKIMSTTHLLQSFKVIQLH